MSLQKTQSNINTPVDLGSVVQVQLTPANIGLSTALAGSGSNASAIVLSCGLKNFAFGITSSQTSTVSIQRYLDQAATIPVGAAITGSLTANVATYVDSVDSVPYQSFIITVANSTSSAATISNCLLLLQAN